jgi:hypothetical protein
MSNLILRGDIRTYLAAALASISNPDPQRFFSIPSLSNGRAFSLLALQS